MPISTKIDFTTGVTLIPADWLDDVSKVVYGEVTTIASHATTALIWASGFRWIDWTGTATTTAFPGAVQAGDERRLRCAGACSFTAGANMLIQGVASGQTITMAANDIVSVFAVTTTQFLLTIKRYSDIGTSAITTGRNHIINGNFDIWQAGTSLGSGTGGRYLADQWRNDSVGSTYTASRQEHTVGQSAVPNEPQYFHRTVVTSVVGAGNYTLFQQIIENVRNYAGKTITLSFYAREPNAAKNIAIEFEQRFGSGGAPSAIVNAIGVTTIALTTAFQKFTVTVAIPSLSGKVIGTTDATSAVFMSFWLEAGSNLNARTNSLGQQSGTFDISQVWIEEGGQSTNFPQRPLAAELALCQRYYHAGSYIVHTSAVYTNLTNPVSMRLAPIITGGGAGFSINTNGVYISSVFQTTLATQALVFDARF